MKKLSKVLALLLAALMVFALAACGKGSDTPSGSGSANVDGETPLVVGYSPFSEKFSPFFAETAYDQDVSSMTQISLINLDRMGQVIYKGIEGETIPYNGTDYTYYGPADIEVTQNPDGTVFYDFTLRDDIKFSDGEPLTIDDVIFSMYVVCDPTYDGSTTLFSQPIEGMAQYRAGIDKRINLIAAAGKDNTDFTFWTEEQQKAYWEMVETAPKKLAEEIANYCWDNGYAPQDDVSVAAGAWGFAVPEGGTLDDFAKALVEAYGDDVISMIEVENAGSSVADFLPDYDAFAEWIEYGESAPSITGIQKTGDYSLRVVATSFDATMIYQLG
ncbi:MAG: ABC transporter substrate-binding protein, partial [Lachnospiraceae bacterium]|nr:ABC transporter substrate-binding protein [Lachnospiraceae bacterium]